MVHYMVKGSSIAVSPAYTFHIWAIGWSLLWVPKTSISLALEHMKVDKYIGELPPTSLPYLVVPMIFARKMVGDHEALRYQRQNVMVKIWKYDSVIPLELLDMGLLGVALVALKAPSMHISWSYLHPLHSI